MRTSPTWLPPSPKHGRPKHMHGSICWKLHAHRDSGSEHQTPNTVQHGLQKVARHFLEAHLTADGCLEEDQEIQGFRLAGHEPRLPVVGMPG